uniref:G_PROTEIN_RECEP_F1_2 domain-containing protein n=1 Tax=Elaeophora elaphi TaxID=1147741 RepID=A0A0R3RJE9_9BILA
MLIHSYSIAALFLILPLTHQIINTTDKADIRDDNYKTMKYVALLLFTISLLYGILINIFATVTFCHRQDNYYSREFILIASQLIICNFMAFLPHIVVVLPEMLQSKNSSYANKTIWINHTFSTFATFSFFSLLHFSLLLALFRYVVLILPKYYAFFQSVKLYSIIAFVWLSVFGMFLDIFHARIVFTDFYYCTRQFLVRNLSWYEKCENPNGTERTWWRSLSFYRIRSCWALFVANVTFVIYIVIFFKIRRKHQSLCAKSFLNFILRVINNSFECFIVWIRITKIRHGHNKKTQKIYHYEWSVLFHAAWNYSILEIGILIIYCLPSLIIKIFGESGDIPSKIFINCYLISIRSLLPTAHFIYNRHSREAIKCHLCHLSDLKLTTQIIHIGLQAKVKDFN